MNRPAWYHVPAVFLVAIGLGIALTTGMTVEESGLSVLSGRGPLAAVGLGLSAAGVVGFRRARLRLPSAVLLSTLAAVVVGSVVSELVGAGTRGLVVAATVVSGPAVGGRYVVARGTVARRSDELTVEVRLQRVQRPLNV